MPHFLKNANVSEKGIKMPGLQHCNTSHNEGELGLAAAAPLSLTPLAQSLQSLSAEYTRWVLHFEWVLS